MNIALRIILWVELLVGVHWTLFAATSWTTGGIAVLAAFFYIYLLFAAFCRRSNCPVSCLSLPPLRSVCAGYLHAKWRPSFRVSRRAATWAWLSLRGGVEPASQKLNYAQMICAAPGVLCGIVLAFWLQGQGVL